jgi:hypothetical protein
MRRTTVTQSLFGLVGLLALASVGCGDWKTFIDEARDNGGSPITPGTGTGGVSGGAVSCSGGVDMNGVMCKRCVDANGMVVYEECSSGGTAGSGGTTGTDPRACVKIEDGGPGSCKDYGIWKTYGADRCAQQMLVLTDLAPGPSCGGTSFQSMTYLCCPPTPPPADTVMCYESKDATGRPCKSCVDQNGKVVGGDCPVMAPPPAQMCIGITDGGPTSCKDPATWKSYGVDRCAQQNLALTDIKLATTCAGGYSTVTYVCCGAPGGTMPTPPPPPPLKCAESTDASGRICKTCYDQYGMVASSDCMGTGSTGTGGATGGGSQTCVGSASADGAMCETCTDQNGKVVSSKCYGGPAPQNEICDVRTNADGSQCKTCYYSDGSTVSDCPTVPPAK